MSLTAIQSLGEPNCTESIVALIRAGEDAGTAAKVMTYVLTFLIALVLSLTLIGAIPLAFGVQEYVRQTAAQALIDHPPTLPAIPVVEAAPAQVEDPNQLASLARQLDVANERAEKAGDLARKRLTVLKFVINLRPMAFEQWRKHVNPAEL